MKASIFFLSLIAFGSQCVRADVGIIVYESKGVDARRTSTGHLALIATNLCAQGVDGVRACREGEASGVAVTRYPGMAFGQDDWFIFVLPLRDYFTATDDGRQAPVLSSGGTLEAMQIEYWRSHLRPYLPALTQEQYRRLKIELDRFDMKKTLERAVTMDLLVHLLMPHKKKYPTEPIALIDPLTNELIPNGRWREAVGAAHTRSSIEITALTTAEQEERLIPFLESKKHEPFQTMSDNCSDFVKKALLEVFSTAGLHFRPRHDNVADAWITSPLEVTSEFVRFAKRKNVPITVTPMPMLAGTRYPTAEITSVTRGALVPNPQQGQLAFGIKVTVNWLNPFIGVAALTLDKLARFVNLRDLVHERGSAQLSRLADFETKTTRSDDEMKAIHREQVKTFGTTSCWKSKSAEFAALTQQAGELGVLTKAEQRLLLRNDQPYLLPRLYERTAAALGQDGVLMAGLTNRNPSLANRGLMSMSFLPPDVASLAAGANLKSDAAVPGRSQVLRMANSDDPGLRIQAFELVTAVINFDLTSEPDHRRSSGEFDEDWALFLDIAKKNALAVPSAGDIQESLQACSCREFDEGKATRDTFADAQKMSHEVVRQARTLVLGPSR